MKYPGNLGRSADDQTHCPCCSCGPNGETAIDARASSRSAGSENCRGEDKSVGRRTGSWYSVSRRGPQGLTGVQNSQDSRFSPKAEALLKAAIQQYGNLSGELVNSVAGHLETKRRAVSRQPSDIALWFSAGATGHHVAHHAHDSIGRDDDSVHHLRLFAHSDCVALCGRMGRPF